MNPCTPLLLRRFILTAAILLAATLGRNAFARTDTWVNLYSLSQGKPANVTFDGSAGLATDQPDNWPIRIVPATPGQAGRMIITRPAGVPAYGYKFFNAHFRFLMWGGNGADGMSFNYGPNENSYVSSTYENGTTSGLAISFDSYRRTQFPEMIHVRWNGNIIASQGLDLWDQTWANQYTTVDASYSPSGLNVVVRQRRFSDYAVLQEVVLVKDYVISGWKPTPDWKFFFAGRTGADTMEILMPYVSIYTSTEPPVISLLPTLFNGTEDTTGTHFFRVDDFESIDDTVVTATSDNQSILPNANILVTPRVGNENYRIMFTPAPNAHGQVNITVRAEQAGDVTTRSFPVNFKSVEDPPVFTVSNHTTLEDTTITTSFGINDVDSNVALIVVTATSNNQDLLPNNGIQISGSGTTRSITLRPNPDRHGTATVTLRATGGGPEVTASFNLTVQPVNDTPVAGSEGVLRLNGAAFVRNSNFQLDPNPNPPHTVEAWVKPSPGLAGRAWIMNLGVASSGGHHWLIHPYSATEYRLQMGLWNITPQITDVSIPIDEWSHLATTWDGTNYVLYVNGILAGQVAIPDVAKVNQGIVQLGGVFQSGDVPFKGEIDELRIWNRALSNAEVQRGIPYAVNGTNRACSSTGALRNAATPSPTTPRPPAAAPTANC
jgi:hypothetical protein